MRQQVPTSIEQGDRRLQFFRCDTNLELRLHGTNQVADLLFDPGGPVRLGFVRHVKVVEETRYDIRVVVTRLAPAFIQPAHAVTTRRDDRAIQETEAPFAGQLQDAFGKRADIGTKVGVANPGAGGADSAQPYRQNPREPWKISPGT